MSREYHSDRKVFSSLLNIIIDDFIIINPCHAE